MSVESKTVTRKFEISVGGKKQILADINPLFSAEEIMEMYAMQYPELVNATVLSHGFKDDYIYYEFKTVAGTKG